MTEEQNKENVASAAPVESSDELVAGGPEAQEDRVEDAACGEAEVADGGSAADDSVALEELHRKASERDTFLEELRRARAELENYQKRVRREKQQWEEQTAGRVIGDFLPVVDSFERALESIHAVDENSRSIEQGVRMIYQMLLRVLGEHGVEEIPASGTFDPEVHEAMVEEEVDDRPTGEITSVLEKGYRLRASVLRPSKVKVARNVSDSVGESSTDASPEENKE